MSISPTILIIWKFKYVNMKLTQHSSIYLKIYIFFWNSETCLMTFRAVPEIPTIFPRVKKIMLVNLPLFFSHSPNSRVQTQADKRKRIASHLLLPFGLADAVTSKPVWRSVEKLPGMDRKAKAEKAVFLRHRSPATPNS